MSLTLVAAQPQNNNALMPTNMESAIRLAEMMATMKLVPAHLQKSPGDCLMVIEQAIRWGMSPMAVAQSTSVIQGKLMFEGKLVAAALMSSGLLSVRLEYEFKGEGDKRTVIATGTIKGESKPRTVEVRISEVRTSNGMWTKQPDQQLIYSANRVWARRHAPEVMLGVYSPEEFEQPSQRAPEPHSGPTIAGKAAFVEIPSMEEPTPAVTEDKFAAMLDAFIYDVAVLQSAHDYQVMVPKAQRFIKMLDAEDKPDLKERAVKAMFDAKARFAPKPEPEPREPIEADYDGSAHADMDAVT